MLKEDNKWWAFSDYSDERLNQRIVYWESCPGEDYCGVLGALRAERDRRVDHDLLHWATKGGCENTQQSVEG